MISIFLSKLRLMNFSLIWFNRMSTSHLVSFTFVLFWPCELRETNNLFHVQHILLVAYIEVLQNREVCCVIESRKYYVC